LPEVGQALSEGEETHTPEWLLPPMTRDFPGGLCVAEGQGIVDLKGVRSPFPLCPHSTAEEREMAVMRPRKALPSNEAGCPFDQGTTRTKVRSEMSTAISKASARR
jgi:hypothetical protein